jgi:hypothetical protein
MLDELKNYLNITWDDEKTDEKVSQILDRAKAILKAYACNVDIDYDIPENGVEKQLLFDCCRLIYNSGYEDFGTNFTGELVNLRAKYQVITNESEADSDETV